MTINKKNILIFCLFFLAAIILTYPLIFNIFYAIPGNGGDSFLYAWNQGWLKYCLLNFKNPYFTDSIAFPFLSNLSFSALTLINSSAGALLQFILPDILAFNIIFLLSLTIGSYFMYQLVYYLTRHRPISFFAGLALVYSSYFYAEITLGHFDYASVYFIPLFLLYLIKIYKEEKISNSVIAGFILAASFYNNAYYTFGLFILIGLTFLFFLGQDKKFILVKTRNLLILMATWCVVSLPLLFISLSGYFSGQYPMPTLNQVDYYSVNPALALAPSPSQTVYGAKFVTYYPVSGHNNVIYLGFTLLILAVIACFLFRKETDFWRSSRPWLIMSSVFFYWRLALFFISVMIVRNFPYPSLFFMPSL